MKKTAVLFICHIVNEETVYRYNHLKSGCDKMGYDLFWALDVENIDISVLPENIAFHKFSFKEFIEEFPYMETYSLEMKKDKVRNIPQAALYLFDKSHQNEYDFIWTIEFDVCFNGNWNEFFEKYQDDDSDLVHTGNSFRTYMTHSSWIDFNIIQIEVRDKLIEDGHLCASLMCCTRLSKRLIDGIKEFLREIDDRAAFFEWVWATVAVKQDYKLRQYFSNYFYYAPPLDQSFKLFKQNNIYHPVKLNIEWKSILERERQ